MTKRGFTLIELLVVIVVLVTLMAIVFRLAGIIGGQEARAVTIKRLQCLENALSGYYAAFGCYPPVKLHGSRNIYLNVNKWGIQEDDGSKSSSLSWSSVNAACRSQPIAARYPFSSDQKTRDMINAVAAELMRRASSDEEVYEAYRKNSAVLSQGFDTLEDPSGQIEDPGESDWRKTQIFKFGLLSYLLPRYLFMTLGDRDLYDGTYAQWTDNNMEQKMCHEAGENIYGWNNMRDDVLGGHSAYVTMIPSQSVCARWMPNLKGVIDCGKTFFGINTRVPGTYSPINVDNPYPEVFPGNGRQYVLDGMTVYDGWGHEFYYYSPPPYQSYRLWSAGPDGKTFPPWIDVSSLSSGKETAGAWMADDIENLKN